MTRSKAAFRLSVNTFFDRAQKAGTKVYMWTFTLRKCLSVDEAFKAYNRLAKGLWRLGLHRETGEQTIYGVRVAEFHPGGHGVHFHVLVNRRIPIWFVRRIAERHGFFWIDVRRAYDSECGEYLAKYLAKGGRPGCFRRRRLWQAFGQWGQTKCKDVEIRSEFSVAYRYRRRMLAEARAIAVAQRKEYRMESHHETCLWTMEHTRRVSLGQVAPMSQFTEYITDETGPPSADFEDWEGAWSELA